MIIYGYQGVLNIEKVYIRFAASFIRLWCFDHLPPKLDPCTFIKIVWFSIIMIFLLSTTAFRSNIRKNPKVSSCYVMTKSSLNPVPLYWLSLPFKQLQLDRWMMLSSTWYKAWTMNQWTEMINLDFDPSYLHFNWYFVAYIVLKKWMEHRYGNVSFLLLLFAMTSCYCCSRFRRTILTINRHHHGHSCRCREDVEIVLELLGTELIGYLCPPDMFKTNLTTRRIFCWKSNESGLANFCV